MSEGKFSIGHFLGIGISVISLVATIVTQCEPPKKPFGALGLEGQGLMVKASGPVIDPRYLFAFEELHWWDSLPFDIDVLADAGVHFVEIERYRLPEDLATKRESINSAKTQGRRELLATYSIDPEKRRIRSFMSKEFGRGTKPGDVESVSARFESGLNSDYPEVNLTLMDGAETTHDVGHWLFGDDGSPRELRFDQAEDEYYLNSEGKSATLAHRGGWLVQVYLEDRGLKMPRLVGECKRIQSEILAKAQLEAGAEVRCDCIQGSRDHLQASVRMNELGETVETYVWEYDTLGRKMGFRSTALDSMYSSRWVKYAYDDAGRVAMVADSSSEVKRTFQFSYLPTGWPEKVVSYKEFPDGKFRVVWLTFFKFKRS